MKNKKILIIFYIKKENDEKKDQINKFKDNFLLKFNRQPTLNELITNNKKLTKEEIEIFQNNLII